MNNRVLQAPGPVLLFLHLLVLACTSDQHGRSDDLFASDSIPVWSLAEDTSRRVYGFVDTGDSLFIHRVSAAALPEEELAIVAIGAPENKLVYFDLAEQTVRRIVGRSGQGPHEFSRITRILDGDGSYQEMAVWDATNRRLTVMDEAGVPKRSLPAPAGSGITVLALLRSDSIVIVRAPIVTRSQETRTYEIWNGDRELLAVVAEISEPSSRLIRLRVVHDAGEGQISTSLPQGCLPRLYEVWGGDGLVIANGKDGSLARLDFRGRLVPFFTQSQRPVLTSEMLGSIRQSLEQVGALLSLPMPSPTGPRSQPGARIATGAIDSIIDLVGAPGSPIPGAWSGLLYDGYGHYWMREASCMISPESERWHVVNRSGTYMGVVTVPGVWRILAVRDNLVLFQSADESGAEFINVATIHQRSPASPNETVKP